MITWIPGHADRRGAIGPKLGINHVSGHRAGATLVAADVPVPPAWTVEQDHPRRGLILRPPADEGNEQVMTWAMRAVAALSTPDRITSWRAEVHLPAG
jgi:hypothetical protein